MEQSKITRCSRIMPVHRRLSQIQTIWCSTSKSKWATRTAINSNLSCANTVKTSLRTQIWILETNTAIPRKDLKQQKGTYWLLASTTSLYHMHMQGTFHWRIYMRAVRNKMGLQWVPLLRAYHARQWTIRPMHVVRCASWNRLVHLQRCAHQLRQAWKSW